MLLFILLTVYLKLGLAIAKNHLGVSATSVISLLVFSILLLVFITYLNSTLKKKHMEFSLVTKCLIGIQLFFIINIISFAIYNVHLDMMAILQEAAKYIAALSPVFPSKELLTLSMNNPHQNPPGNVAPNPAPTGNPPANPPLNPANPSPRLPLKPGVIFDPVKEEYGINDGEGVAFRPYNAQGSKQPYASYLANALDHHWENNRPNRQITNLNSRDRVV
jgi:hypothetical protein